MALLIGIIALPIEFRQIELLARLIGNPLLLLVAHVGAVLGLLALLVFSFVWLFRPGPSRPQAQLEKERNQPQTEPKTDQQRRVTAELNRRKTNSAQ
ncbi:MAG: hypothetical protein K1Y36_21810 [Blastocatellia bacterium]|nr:hypothetical protein [Blastocatellia bacterium]